MMRTVGVIMCSLCLCTAAAHADILCLKDGRIINGPSMEQADGGINIRYENGTVFVPDGLILEAIIGGNSTFVPTTDFEKKQVEKGLVPFQGKWMSPVRRDRALEKYLEEKRAEVADEKAHRLWRNRRSEKTKHFDFEYTVPQNIFEKYRDLMEAYFTVFAKDWKVQQLKSLGRLKVCFYIDRESFAQIGGAGGGTSAYFKYVLPFELNFFYDRLDTESTEGAMFHEANHYLTKLINLDFKYPHFPGESLAEYYGASKYDPKTKKLDTGLIQEGRLTEIQTDIAAGNMMELDKLIKTEGMYEHYSWGWSLVHFLMNDSKYKKKFQKFAIALAKARDVERVRSGMNLKTVRGEEILRAFKSYMKLGSEEDFKALESEWHSYVKDDLKLTTSRGKEKAAAAAMSTYPSRPIRAKRLYSEAIEEGSTNPVAYYKYGELLYDDKKTEEAVKMWMKAIELDSLNPEFYARMGRALAKEGDKKEGARLMQLAIEIDPDYAWKIETQLEKVLEDMKGGEGD